MKKIVLTLCCCWIITDLVACLNEVTKVLQNGYILYEMSPTNSVPTGYHFNVPKGDVMIKSLQKSYKETQNIDYLSDIGYVYITQGRYKEALAIYKKIEKIKPNQYATASNVGTLYELIGEHEKALKWIKKAIGINARAHDGSEWLHVRILEAKLQGQAFVDTISSEFLIGTSFGERLIPRSDLSIPDLRKLINDIHYQLNERVTFIKGKDKIMARLFFDLANALADRDISKDPDDTEIILYKKAKRYGFSDPIVDQRIAFLKKINEQKEVALRLAKEKQKQKEQEAVMKYRMKRLFYYGVWGVGLLLLVGGLFYKLVYVRHKK